MSEPRFKSGDRVWYQKSTGFYRVEVQKYLGAGEISHVLTLGRGTWYRAKFDDPASGLNSILLADRYLVLENPLEALAQMAGGTP